MNEVELRNFIISVVRQTLAPIIMGNVVENEDALFGKAKQIGKASAVEARNVQPFGFSSRASKDMPALLIPVMGDPSHVNVVGHADPAKPDVADGEVALYNEFGQVVYLSNGKLQFGSKASAEPMVLGTQLQTLLSEMLQILANHTHPGIGSPPTDGPQLSALKSSPVEDGAILSDKAFTEK